MENLRGNLSKLRKGIIQNEVSLGGSPTINVILDVDNGNCEMMMLVIIVKITMVFMMRIKIC